jgi:hypothetical protein
MRNEVRIETMRGLTMKHTKASKMKMGLVFSLFVCSTRWARAPCPPPRTDSYSGLAFLVDAGSDGRRLNVNLSGDGE